MLKHKFIGTIIDKSYFDIWRDGDNVYRMCYNCDKPMLMKDRDGFAHGKKHYCEMDRKYWLNLMSNPDFIFIPAKEEK